MHESLINESESQYTIESDGTYIILSPTRFLENIVNIQMQKKSAFKVNTAPRMLN